MRLSTKGKYALEALTLLGHKTNSDIAISLNIISTETKISEGYLEQLFRLLKKHSVVSSKKGKNGGYYFAAPMDVINVGDILRAVEGSLAPVKCVDDGYCNRTEKCLTRDLWGSVYEKINETINNISMQKLVDDYEFRLASKENAR